MTQHQLLACGALMLLVAACGAEPPTASPEPEPPAAIVEWPELVRLYDDPLYRRLPFLLGDSNVGRALDGRMSELVVAIHAQDAEAMRAAMGDVHAIREAYAMQSEGHPSDRLVLAALYQFELRGSSSVRYDSLALRDARLTMEDAP